MVYWNAEEIQQRGFPPGVRHSDRWRNLDIPVWPRNKAPVLGLGLSRWATPTKVKRQRSVGKKMVATFFSTSGHLATVVLEDQRTVTVKWYSEVWLPQVFSKIQEKRRRTGLRGLLLHHDNASFHIANASISFLEKTPVKLMTHPAYSPDLALCDIFLFPNVKNCMRGHQFPSPEDAVAAYNEELSQCLRTSGVDASRSGSRGSSGV